MLELQKAECTPQRTSPSGRYGLATVGSRWGRPRMGGRLRSTGKRATTAVMPTSRSSQVAMKVKAIGWFGFISFLLLSTANFLAAVPAGAPLQLVGSVPLPGFTGDFDHFAVDEKGGRLFLAGEDHKTVEVFELKTGHRLKSLSGFGTPHSVFYLPDSDRILITDGDPGALKIFRGSDYTQVGSVDGLAGVDSGRIDEATKTLYLTAGGKDVPLDYSSIVAIDLRTNKKVGELRIESNHIEAFELEKSSSRLFLNLTDKHAVVVIDRKAMKEIARWPIGSQADNSPMAYDEAHHRLLIVCRKPGTLLVMDSDSGKVVAQLPAAERSDDIAFDAPSGRIYVPGGDGRIFVFHQASADKYELVGKVASAPGAKTCALVPDMARLFVAVSPGESNAEAKVLIYSVAP